MLYARFGLTKNTPFLNQLTSGGEGKVNTYAYDDIDICQDRNTIGNRDHIANFIGIK